MIIHVVQPGETIDSISKKYKIPVTNLIRDNGITNPNNLVIGQTIVILYPKVTYTVQKGDSLRGIAAKYNVSLMELLRNNSHLSDRDFLIPGETIVISFNTNKKRRIATSGYAYPHIDKNILIKTLPYLSYVTIFNYRFTMEGDIIEIDDIEVVRIAKSYGVAPMMLISTLSERGVGNSEVANNILNNLEVQDHLIDNVIEMLRKKGYYGLNIYIQFLRPENRLIEERFVERFTTRIKSEGFRILITLTPRTNIERTEVTYESIDYTKIAELVDAILFLSYEWGYSYGPPASVTPVNILERVISSITKQIPSEKIFLGLPVIGYDWQLPYIPGTSMANAVTTTTAIEIAAEKQVPIQYNEISEAPYFFYNRTEQELHIVWFKDARSIDAISNLVPLYNMQGLSIWNIMYFFQQMWFVINAEYEIEKVLNDL